MSENKGFNGGEMPEYCSNIHEIIREKNRERIIAAYSAS